MYGLDFMMKYLERICRSREDLKKKSFGFTPLLGENTRGVQYSTVECVRAAGGRLLPELR